jgi:bifunctional non-homologous end joining protein LigD
VPREKQAKVTASRFAGVRLTHPERVLYAEQGVTKADLADYLLAVAEPMLQHVAGRPLSLVRCPEGQGKPCFFQRHKSKGVPSDIRGVTIAEKDGKKAEYLYVEDERGLVACAQLGVLELHVWGATVADVEKPDRLVMDLDPAEDVGFGAVKDAARTIRDRLASAGLESFPLLTGGKGVHVVAPLAPTRGWEEVKAFARGLAEALAAAEPERFIAKASKAARHGKIFIDWMRNERGATAIAPLSPRARAGAPVAAPLRWNELSRAKKAAAYDLATMRRRLGALGESPWAGYFDIRQEIAPAALAQVRAATAG